MKRSWRGKFTYDTELYKNDPEYRHTVEYTKLLIKAMTSH